MGAIVQKVVEDLEGNYSATTFLIEFFLVNLERHANLIKQLGKSLLEASLEEKLKSFVRKQDETFLDKSLQFFMLIKHFSMALFVLEELQHHSSKESLLFFLNNLDPQDNQYPLLLKFENQFPIDLASQTKEIEKVCFAMAINDDYQKLQNYLSFLFSKNQTKKLNIMPIFDHLRTQKNVNVYQMLIDFLISNEFEFQGLEFDGYTDLLLELEQFSFAVEIQR